MSAEKKNVTTTTRRARDGLATEEPTLGQRLRGSQSTNVDRGTNPYVRDQKETTITMAKLMSSMLDDGNREALTTMQNSRDRWATEAAEFIRAAKRDPVLSKLATVCGAEVLRDSEEVIQSRYGKED